MKEVKDGWATSLGSLQDAKAFFGDQPFREMIRFGRFAASWFFLDSHTVYPHHLILNSVPCGCGNTSGRTCPAHDTRKVHTRTEIRQIPADRSSASRQQLRPERGARSWLVVHVAPKPDLEYLDRMRSLPQGQQEDAVHDVVLVRLHLVSDSRISARTLATSPKPPERTLKPQAPCCQ